jgi:hypothetical protein
MRRLPNALPRAAAATLALLAAGCADEFTPSSLLDETRILALTSDPLEAGPGDVVTADALVYQAPGDTIASETWTFCPLTTGAAGGYRCVLEACETPVPGSLTVNPLALAEACVAAAGGAPGGGEGVPVEVESVFRLRIQTGPRASRGDAPLEAVLRLPLSTVAPAARNLPPVLSSVTAGGVPAAPDTVVGRLPAAGGRLELAVEIDPASVQTYVDGTGRTVQESVVVSFFTTAGRFTEERGEAPRATTVLEAEALPADATEAEVWIVARDLRGGQAWDGPYRISIDRQ